jgi:hypothetical protein
MNDSALRDLMAKLAVGPNDEIAAHLRTSTEPAALIVLALFDPAPDRLLTRAEELATSTQDRQLAVIARAHIAGDRRRAEALGRDHLLDHPDHPIVLWMLAGSA